MLTVPFWNLRNLFSSVQLNWWTGGGAQQKQYWSELYCHCWHIMQCCMDHLPWDIISLPLPTYFFHAMPNFLARVKTKLSEVHCLVALMTAPCTGRQPPWTHTSGLICRGTVVTLWWPRLPHVTPVIRVWVLTALVNFFLLNYIWLVSSIHFYPVDWIIQ